MKSKLSNKGYVIIKKHYSDSELKKIKKELNVFPFNAYQSNFIQTPSFPVYLESLNKLYLPRIWGIQNLGQPEQFKINEGVNIDLKFNGSLRPIQKEAIQAYMKNCYPEYGSGTLCLGCGSGKTVIGLNIVSELKKKTLIVVHKEFLLNQWIERIKMFLPDAQIGRIQAKKFDVVGKDIVIAMLQSISMKNYDEDAFNSFGLTIVDECFVGSTLIKTECGLYKIEDLYNLWNNGEILPRIWSYNIKEKILELKQMTYGWEKKQDIILELWINNIKVKCTTNHKFLTENGYKEANKLTKQDMIFCINKDNNICCDNIKHCRPILTNSEFVYDISL